MQGSDKNTDSLPRETKPAQRAVVYVVDDDEGIRFTIKNELPNAWDVREFECAENLLAAVEKKRPDLVIADLRLPGLSGKELISLLRHAGLEIPVIFVSGFADRSDIIDFTKLRIHSYFDKPFNLKALVASACDALNGWKYLQSLEHISLLSELEEF